MFFLVDKPIGMSSFDVIRKLRKVLNIKKMGHIGTLDPLASGCLLIATEGSTKLIPLFDNAKKEYIFTIRLDGISDSLDRWTPIRETTMSGYIRHSSDELRNYILTQTSQIPPRYSALHINGSRAYELARNGEDFDLKEREIKVDSVEILSIKATSLVIGMTISSWGYVRSFAPLIWKFFWVQWGYVESLRRTKIITNYWELSINEASNIDNITWISYSKIFPTIHTLEITHEEYIDLTNGKSLLKINNSTIHPNNGDRIFLSYPQEGFLSLCVYKENSYSIIRNNV